MTPGIPGVGLGGLFFLICVLVAPILELVQTFRGQSSLERWRLVIRQAAMAASIVFATTVSLWLFETILIGIGGSGPEGSGVRLAGASMEALKWLPLSGMPVLFTLALLMFVLGCTEMLRLVLNRLPKRTKPARSRE